MKDQYNPPELDTTLHLPVVCAEKFFDQLFLWHSGRIILNLSDRLRLRIGEFRF